MNTIVDKSFYLTSLFVDMKSDTKWTEYEIKTVLMLFSKLDEHKVYLPDYYSDDVIFDQDRFSKTIDNIPREYVFSKKDFADVTSVSSSHLAREINKVRTSLVKKTINTPHPLDSKDGESGESISWFSKITYSNKTGDITIKVNEDALDRLIAFVKYTKVDFSQIIKLKNNNAIYYFLFFKIMKDASKNQSVEMTINDFKERVNLSGKYIKISHFREKILEVVKCEINEYTDLILEYELIKEGRAYTKIKFSFSYKPVVIKAKKEKKEVTKKTDTFTPDGELESSIYDSESEFERILTSWGIRARTVVDIEDTYSLDVIANAIEETQKAEIDGRIKKTKASFFMGTLDNKQKNDDEMFEREMMAVQNKQESALKAAESEKKESQYRIIESDISLHEDDLSRYLSSKSMGATIDISTELSEFLERLSYVDKYLFKGYKPNFAVLDKGYFDYETQKQIRPNMYDFLKLVIDQNSV